MSFKIVNNSEKLYFKCPKSLNEKIHLRDNSKSKYLFAFGQLGKSMWKDALSKINFSDFTFFDPYNHETPTEYNSLFDPNLQSYFSRKNIRNHLIKNNLITSQNEIIFSIQEFNNYRKCLYRLKALGAFEDNKRNIDSLNTNRKSFNSIDKNFTVSKRSLNPLRFENVLKDVRIRKANLEAERHMRNLKKVQSYMEKTDNIKKLQELRKNKIYERGLHRNVEITKKRIYVIENLKKRRAQIKKKMLERDGHLKRIRNHQSEPINYIIRCPI
ncbi:hypothetical protein PVAND_011325 [Polypedilum vanderplanki]|uniref:Fibrous sheath-interacting protein 2 n=1 Tax=Polypedilum vanderplanki TaxID=319348 RepID=A0A9J6CI77_POLVA|nr:hypothetical protein PVAND_011325 [Polypedilum vanderplanki]